MLQLKEADLVLKDVKIDELKGKILKMKILVRTQSELIEV